MSKPPEHLGRAGKAAWKRAQGALADQARAEWREAGRPFSKESGSAVHPLIRVMQDADRDAARYGEALGLKPERVAHRGPDPVATMTADIGESPAARLRRVQ